MHDKPERGVRAAHSFKWIYLVAAPALLVCGFLLWVGNPLIAAGRALTAEDPLQPATWAVITPESQEAGEIEAADLVHRGFAHRVIVLVPNATRAERELQRRRVDVGNVTMERLEQLGVTSDVVSFVAAGEGGTTESVATLVSFGREHPTEAMIVITSPTHAGRVRRVIAREWPTGRARPIIRATRFEIFDSEDWWRSRGPLRQGIVELQKLALDYVTHPF